MRLNKKNQEKNTDINLKRVVYTNKNIIKHLKNPDIYIYENYRINVILYTTKYIFFLFNLLHPRWAKMYVV